MKIHRVHLVRVCFVHLWWSVGEWVGWLPYAWQVPIEKKQPLKMRDIAIAIDLDTHIANYTSPSLPYIMIDNMQSASSSSNGETSQKIPSSYMGRYLEQG